MPLSISQQPWEFSQSNEDQIFTFARPADPSLRYFKVYFVEHTTGALLTVFKCPVTVDSNDLYDFGYVNVKSIISAYIRQQYNNSPLIHHYRTGQFSYHLEVVPVVSSVEQEQERFTTSRYVVIQGHSLDLGELYAHRLMGNQIYGSGTLFLTDNDLQKRIMVGQSEPVSFVVHKPELFSRILVGYHLTPGPQLDFNIVPRTGLDPDEHLFQFNLSREYLEAIGHTWIEQARYVSVSVQQTDNAVISVNRYYRLVTRDEMFSEFTCAQRERVVNLIWRNRLGGYEKFYFVDNRLETTTDKPSYDGTNLRWSDGSQTGYPVNEYVTSVPQGGKDMYLPGAVNMGFKTVRKRTLVSPSLSDQEAVWISSLVESPEVYVEEGGSIRPVRVSETQYQTKRRAQDKVFRLTVTIETTNYTTN